MDPLQKAETESKKNEILASEMLLIQKFLDRGQAEKAWNAMRSIYPKYPEKPEILNLTGLIHLALDNNLKAIRVFRKSFKLKPKTSTGLNLSSAYISYGNYQKARKILVQLIKSGQSYKYPERLWHNLALTWEKQKNHRKALRYYKKGLKANPTYVLSLTRVGDIYLKTKKKAQAVRYYSKASQFCPGCFEPVNSLVSVWLSDGKYSQAVSLLRKFLSKEQKDILPKERKKARSLLRLAQKVSLKNNRK